MDSSTGRIVPLNHPNAVAVPEHLTEAAEAVERLGLSMWDETHPYKELRDWANANRQIPQNMSQNVDTSTQGWNEAPPEPKRAKLTTRKRPDGKLEFLIDGEVATAEQLAKMGVRYHRRNPEQHKLHVRELEQKKAALARKRKLQKERKRR